MKLKHLGIFLLLSTMAVFSACSDDDDNKGPAEDLAVEIEGNYFGPLDVKVGDEASDPSSNFIFLKRTAKNEVELKLESFSFGEIQLKDAITLGGIKLDGKSQDVVLKENKQDIKLDLGGESITATVVTNGTVKGKELDLTLDIDAGGLKIAVKFKGELVGEVAIILYDMEEWVVENTEVTDESKWIYVPGPEGVWGTSNKGAALAGAKCVSKSEAEHVYSGKASAKIETKDTKPSPFLASLIPRVTSGSLFTGVFDLEISNPLTSTKFGISFDKKPLSVNGYYKYSSGVDFYEVQAGNKKGAPTLVPDRKDKCAIGVYLYEYDPADEEVKKYNSYLTGENIKNSDRVIAKAELEDGTEKANYTFFELNLKYIKEYDSSKKYRLAIIASSSAEGDAFNGAPGSVLYLDDIEVSYIPN